MRYFSLLAFVGFSFLFTSGCGVITQIANDTCAGTNYNKIICPGILEEALPPAKAPKATPKAAHTRLCYGVSVRTTHGVNNLAHTDQGPYCKSLQNEAMKRAFESKPGTNCSIEGKGKKQRVVCAGFDHPVGILLILLTLLWGRGLRDFVVANVENEGTHRPFDGMWPACKTMILAIVGIIIILAAGGAYASPRTAAYGGCSVSSDETVIELFEDSCSPEVLEELIEQVGLVCTQEHRMEGASLSMAAPTEQGLSEEADLRHRFLEVLCWNQAGFGCFSLLLGFLGRRKYKIFDNRRFALTFELDNGIIVAFREHADWLNYQFEEIDGVHPVEAIWVPSGRVGGYSFFKSKLWFAADKIRTFNGGDAVKRDPAYPGRFIEAPVMELKESVFQALTSGSLEGVPDDELQDIINLDGYGSTFVDTLRRARNEVERFAYPWRCKDGSVLPAHDQKVIVLVDGQGKRVDPSILLQGRDHLLSQLTAERFRRELLNSSHQDAWQRNQELIKSNLEILMKEPPQN